MFLCVIYPVLKETIFRHVIYYITFNDAKIMLKRILFNGEINLGNKICIFARCTLHLIGISFTVQRPRSAIRCIWNCILLSLLTYIL